MIRICPILVCCYVLYIWRKISQDSILQKSPTIETLSLKCKILMVAFFISLLGRFCVQVVFLFTRGNYERASCSNQLFIKTRIGFKIIERLFPLIIALLC
ncbi:hypothetical protein FGO68_gene3962 [Halteria grandinella]|uniref:Uncharacterized protein n=1 Tax=Halteria grandinella TaxID=5974 RepID=A0A8J8NWE9_HALGN|nr:hypothetical protein FGO68_gene3962 [Halteria grandinella]